MMIVVPKQNKDGRKQEFLESKVFGPYEDKGVIDRIRESYNSTVIMTANGRRRINSMCDFWLITSIGSEIKSMKLEEE